MPANYSFVAGKTQLIDPNNGSFVDTWDGPVNSNFGVIDASVSGTTVINIPANTTPGTPYVTLTFPTYPTYAQPWTQPLAAQNLRLLLQGALSYNATVYIPANVPGMWLIDNQTTNGFILTIKTNSAGSQGVAVPQGYMSYIFCDGTNVYWADQGNIISNAPQGVPTGSIMAFAMTNPPINWLVCNGAAVSRTAYAVLFSTIGTAWGAGDGSSTFNLPNFQGYFLRGWNSTASGPDPSRAFASSQANGVGPLTVNDPGHFHKVNPNSNGNGIVGWTTPGGQGQGWASGNYGAPTAFVLQTETATTGITITNTISETRPDNYAVQYCIRT